MRGSAIVFLQLWLSLKFVILNNCFLFLKNCRPLHLSSLRFCSTFASVGYHRADFSPCMGIHENCFAFASYCTHFCIYRNLIQLPKWKTYVFWDICFRKTLIKCKQMQIISTYHQIHNGGQLPRQWALLCMSTHDSFPLTSKRTPPNFMTFPKIYLATIWYDVSRLKQFDVSMATVFWQACFSKF